MPSLLGGRIAVSRQLEEPRHDREEPSASTESFCLQLSENIVSAIGNKDCGRPSWAKESVDAYSGDGIAILESPQQEAPVQVMLQRGIGFHHGPR